MREIFILFALPPETYVALAFARRRGDEDARARKERQKRARAERGGEGNRNSGGPAKSLEENEFEVIDFRHADASNLGPHLIGQVDVVIQLGREHEGDDQEALEAP